MQILQRLFTGLTLFLTISCFGQASVDTVFIVYFKNDQSKLSRSERSRIDHFITQLNNPVITSVSGYTDKNGSESYNKNLSARRSYQVSKYLERVTGLTNFQIHHFGEKRTISSLHALNRRVEITVKSAEITAPVGVAVLPGKPVVKTPEEDTTIIERINFENIYFVPDMAMVEFSSLAYIDRLGSVLRAYKNEKFEIRGHVNCPLSLLADTAYMKKMDQLSEARAKEVYMQLIRRGIPAGNLSYLGMSNREMLYPNAKNQAEQRKNMRVEVVVRRKD